MNKTSKISLLSVSFHQGFTSPNIPIASFKQGDKDLVFLLDTGSDDNVINKDALQYIDHKMVEINGSHTLSGVNGTIPVQHCDIDFSCEEETYNARFLIADFSDAFGVIKRNHCITIHGVLGSKFLKEHNVVLDFKNLAAYSKK